MEINRHFMGEVISWSAAMSLRLEESDPEPWCTGGGGVGGTCPGHLCFS